MAAGRIAVFAVFVLVLSEIEAARILMYIPTPSISHQVVFRPLSQALAARGHEVTVVTTDPVFKNGYAPANLTEIDVHDISYDSIAELIRNHKGQKQDFKHQMLLYFERFATIFDLQMQTPGVKEIMKKDRKYFDVLLLEACNRLLIGLTIKFDAPVILLSSMGGAQILYNHFGAPIHPLLYPAPTRQRLYNLSPIEKITELYKQIAFEHLMEYTQEYDTKILKKNFGEDAPSFHELSKRNDLVFLNEYQLWADNHPVPPSIVFIGGIHQATEKDLPIDIQKFLDASKHGAIYISFGSNVIPSLLPQEKIEAMAKVFSELPYNVLWKYDKDVLPGTRNYKNIKLSKWFPQTDILRHPNLKLFITQGGAQSTDETINAAVPVICIPMLGDQWYNAEKFVYHKVGLQLDISSLTEEEFKTSIDKVIKDKSYKENMLRLSEIIRASPIKPIDLAVWWTEYVIKYGGRHLYAPAGHVTWTEYYELKLVFTVLAILISVVILIGLILKAILRYIYRLLFETKRKVKSN